MSRNTPGRGRAAAALTAVLLAMAPVAAAASERVEVDLVLAGHDDLGGDRPFGDVAVVGTAVLVVSGTCPAATVKVVDVSDPKRPRVTATVPLPGGTAAVDLDAEAVVGPSFTGDLVAVALAPCGRSDRGGVLYYDVSDGARPRLLAEERDASSSWVALAQRDDGRVLSLRAGLPGGIAVADTSDPARPAPAGQWSAPAGGCGPGQVFNAEFDEGGLAALAVLTDGRVYGLDLADPAHPASAGEAAVGSPGFAAVMPVGTRTLGIVTEQRSGDACSEPAVTPGLRLIELTPGGPGGEERQVRFTTAADPGRLVASGELAYVAWRADGVRVVDVGAVRGRVIAQFIPERADVVGVGLLADHVVVSDANTGLYVLERPDEGGQESSFWSNVAGLLPYLLFAAVLAALFVVPRLAMGRVPQGTTVPSPVPERAHRRRWPA